MLMMILHKMAMLVSSFTCYLDGFPIIQGYILLSLMLNLFWDDITMPLKIIQASELDPTVAAPLISPCDSRHETGQLATGWLIVSK